MIKLPLRDKHEIHFKFTLMARQCAKNQEVALIATRKRDMVVAAVSDTGQWYG